MIVIGALVDTHQPPHLGIKQAYDIIVKARGPQYSYVIVTDKKDTSEANITEPLTAADKEQILVKHGVPTDKVVLGKTFFDTTDLEKIYDPNDTAIVFYFFSDKGDVGYANDKVIPWDEGQKASARPMSEVVYYSILPRSIKQVKGLPLTTKLFVDELGNPQNPDDNKKTFFALAFGWYDAGFFALLKERFGRAYEKFTSRYASAIGKPTMEESIEELTKIMVRELADQISDPQLPAMEKPAGEDDLSPSEKAAEKVSNVEKLRQKEKALKLTKKQADAQKELDKNKLRNMQKDLTQTKRDMSQTKMV